METNNKLREALSTALEQVNKVYDILSRPYVVIEEARQGCREARGVLIPALAAPPRNCDVGTAMEQTLRFRAFCERHGECMGEDRPCPLLLTPGLCDLIWAQMPYEEGGAK